MQKNLKNRLAKVNTKLAKYGFRTISEIDAIKFNSIMFPESAQDGGWKIIDHCKPNGMLGYEVEKFFNRKDAAQIGNTLIEISRTYSGVDIY
jgi:hypothetical protein